MNVVKSFLRDESGATSIEYAIMAASVAVVVIAAVNNLGSTVKGTYASVNLALK